MLSWLSKKKDPDARVAKHAARVANRRGYAPERWESIQILAEIKSEKAVEALLVRFTFTTDPSITDQDEKQAVFDAVVEAGEVAVQPLKRFLAKASSTSWGLKCLQSIVGDERFEENLLALLETLDVEYERDPQRKIELLSVLETFRGEQVVAQGVRFLEDVNETVRFHAASVLAVQEASVLSDAVRQPVAMAFAKEDSRRIQSRLLDLWARLEWTLPESLRQGFTPPPGYRIDKGGRVLRA